MPTDAPLCLLLLPRGLDGFILREQAEDLLTAAGVVAAPPTRLPAGALLRLPPIVGDAVARGEARRITKRAGGRVTKPDGRTGRVDQLLGRSIPGPHQERREYLIVELKRPSAKADRKMLNQISDYALALAGAPDFRHTDTRWNFFLVVGEYDDIVGQAITQEGREIGIAVRQPNYTVWVRCWGEILRECDARLQYIQDHLKVEISDEEIASRLRALQTSFGREAATTPRPRRGPDLRLALSASGFVVSNCAASAARAIRSSRARRPAAARRGTGAKLRRAP